MIQLKNIIGKRVAVNLKATDDYGRDQILSGILSFYHFDKQVVHLSDVDYIRSGPPGSKICTTSNVPFLIINTNEWKTLNLLKEEN